MAKSIGLVALGALATMLLACGAIFVYFYFGVSEGEGVVRAEQQGGSAANEGAALVLPERPAQAEEPAQAASPAENGKIAVSGGGCAFVMWPDGSEKTCLGSEYQPTVPVWSPDGTKIAFSGNDSTGNYGVYVMNADGSGITKITHGDGEIWHSPTWSPDGDKIAFAMYPPGFSTSDIYVVDADDGSNPTRLTTQPRFGTRYETPDWSPDGNRIAYGGLFTMDAVDGSNVERVPGTREGYAPAWSPDGTRIAFSKRPSSEFDIYVTSLTGGAASAGSASADLAPTRLTYGTPDSHQESFHPDWSPDGSKIVFMRGSARGGSTNKLYIMNSSDGSGATNIDPDNDYHGWPDWQRSPLDSVQPTVRITKPLDGAFTNGTAILSAEAEDDVAISHVRFFVDGEEVGTDSSAPYSLSWDAQTAGDGDVTVTARASDSSYNFTDSPQKMLRVDTARPNGEVAINGGRASTTNRDVTLRLSTSDPAPASGVASVRIKDGGSSWIAWRPYAKRKDWKLTRGEGTKTVYAQFKDGAGNVSPAAKDTIQYRP